MTITPSELRKDIYNLLDRVIETGEPLEVDRNGTVLRIVPPSRAHWLDRLPRRPEVLAGDPADLPEVRWEEAWEGGDPS